MATATKTIEFLGTGRRKTAIARVRLATGSGKITVNGRAFESYFPFDTLRATVSQRSRFGVFAHSPESKLRRAAWMADSI